GEVSLAHHGVLFLDELPEYSRQSMEVLRQPLEDGTVTISRVFGTYSYPCSVMLVGAMNPCPCGYFGHPTRRCICGSQKVELYLNRVSGPILDRLDLHVDVPPVKFDELSEIQKGELSANIRQRVNAAREIQNARFSGTQISCNAKIIPQKLQEFCRTTPAAQKAISSVFDKLGLSARGYDRILKVARTIADLDGGGVIDAKHIFEAVQYRNLDRKYWNK
ncbi:MAG: ATP-binding protein, partial [Oscillospiraceae bacterium]|nr:ATP-binding protein [Oscillospiraceae bacterium]